MAVDDLLAIFMQYSRRQFKWTVFYGRTNPACCHKFHLSRSM